MVHLNGFDSGPPTSGANATRGQFARDALPVLTGLFSKKQLRSSPYWGRSISASDLTVDVNTWTETTTAVISDIRSID